LYFARHIIKIFIIFKIFFILFVSWGWGLGIGDWGLGKYEVKKFSVSLQVKESFGKKQI
jgi:hypothetical protein